MQQPSKLNHFGCWEGCLGSLISTSPLKTKIIILKISISFDVPSSGNLSSGQRYKSGFEGSAIGAVREKHTYCKSI